MNKIIISIVTLLSVLLIIGCSASEVSLEVPPDPPSIGEAADQALAGKAYDVVDGVATCYTDQQLENLFAENPDLQRFESNERETRSSEWGGYGGLRIVEGTLLNFTTGGSQWIFGTGYVLKNCDEWQPVNFGPADAHRRLGHEDRSQAHFFRDTNWITVDDEDWSSDYYAVDDKPTAEARSMEELVYMDDSWSKEGSHYAAAFACDRDPNGWDCNDGKWVLSPFRIEGGIPLLSNIHTLYDPDAVVKVSDWTPNWRARPLVSSPYWGANFYRPEGVDLSDVEIFVSESEIVVKNPGDYLESVEISPIENNGVVICPGAETVDDVQPGCPGEIIYTHADCENRDLPFFCWGDRYRVSFDNAGHDNDIGAVDGLDIDGSVGVGQGPDPCANGIQDNDETDVDCGGSCGATCTDSQACQADADCVSDICENNECFELPEVQAPAEIPQ